MAFYPFKLNFGKGRMEGAVGVYQAPSLAPEDTHPRRAGARQFGPKLLGWHVGGDQLALSRPALCTASRVSLNTGWLVGWPTFPAPWGTQPSPLASQHRGFRTHGRRHKGSSAAEVSRSCGLLWDASIGFSVSRCKANHTGDDSSRQPRPTRPMVNNECQEGVSEWT